MRLRFEDVTFDAETHELWRGRKPVHVSPKAFSLLALLVERRPRPVDKPTIHQRLWPDTFVSPANLPSLLAELREALGDDAQRPRFLRTVRGVGYAFRASEEHEPASASDRSAEQPRAWLVRAEGELPLFGGENIVGREGAGVTVVGSSTVSRRHARIEIGDAAATVEDVGSKNGTFLNDRPVTSPVALSDGDSLRFGSRLFGFRLARSSASTRTQSRSGTPPAR